MLSAFFSLCQVCNYVNKVLLCIRNMHVPFLEFVIRRRAQQGSRIARLNGDGRAYFASSRHFQITYSYLKLPPPLIKVMRNFDLIILVHTALNRREINRTEWHSGHYPESCPPLSDFSALPDELLLTFFSWLDVPDIVHLMQCCKRLEGLGSEEQVWAIHAKEMRGLCSLHTFSKPLSSIDSSREVVRYVMMEKKLLERNRKERIYMARFEQVGGVVGMGWTRGTKISTIPL